MWRMEDRPKTKMSRHWKVSRAGTLGKSLHHRTWLTHFVVVFGAVFQHVHRFKHLMEMHNGPEFLFNFDSMFDPSFLLLIVILTGYSVIRCKGIDPCIFLLVPIAVKMRLKFERNWPDVSVLIVPSPCGVDSLPSPLALKYLRSGGSFNDRELHFPWASVSSSSH